MSKSTETKSFWLTPAPPPSGLARYRQLSPRAGVHVSPIQLGAMSIGDKWAQYGMGEMNKEDSFKLLDAFYEKGGNFIDTANIYQDGSSEEFLGEWMEQRGNRDQMVIATKYSSNLRVHDDITHKVNYVGNSAKSLHVSLAASLARLRTSYIDIFYVHFWDWATSIEEVMNALHAVVMSGKVLYLGISDTPAWVVSRANQYARDHGKTPFVIYQGRWNVLDRSFEREIIPMAMSEGMALAPWDVLCAGKLRSDEEDERRKQSNEKGRMIFVGNWERSDDQIKMSRVLQEIGKELGTNHVSAVAIAYVMQKTPFVFPIIGGRKVEHLTANLDSLEIALTDEHIKKIEGVIDFDPGFPANFVGPHDQYAPLLTNAGHFEQRPVLRAIKPTPTKQS